MTVSIRRAMEWYGAPLVVYAKRNSYQLYGDELARFPQGTTPENARALLPAIRDAVAGKPLNEARKAARDIVRKGGVA